LHSRPPGSAKTLDIQYDGQNKDRFTADKLLIAEVMNGNIMARTAPGAGEDLDPAPARRVVRRARSRRRWLGSKAIRRVTPAGQ